MSNSAPAGLHMCPDCGGILEPPQPSWAAAIEVVAAGIESPHDDTGLWQCPLCGYQQDPSAAEEARSAFGS